MGKAQRLKVAQNEARESIKITNGFLQNKTVFMAMGDLLKGYYDMETAYALEKLSRRLNQAQKVFATDSEAIIKKYTNHDKDGNPLKKMEAAVDEKGEKILDAEGKEKMVPVDFDWKMITEKNGVGEDVTTNGKELAEIEFQNLAEKETVIDVYKFYRQSFSSSKLTVAQWMSLGEIIADPFVDETAEEA